ncbi:MAG: NAD(P)/FAD-dependent oxidoreductase [Candidatus Velthaea sp.]
MAAPDFELIVAGAGPAGAAAALELARAGRRVALVDRAVFPRDKPCGDLLGTWAMTTLRRLGIDLAQFASYPPLHGAMLHGPSGRRIGADVDARFDARVIPRTVFDAALVRAACDAGATFVRANVMRALSEHGRIVGIVTPAGDLRAPLTIGAEGWSSAIARAIVPQPRKPRDAGIAARAYLEHAGALDGRMQFYILPPGDGYAWLFPLPGGGANAGLGYVRGEPAAAHVHDAFARFVRERAPGARIASDVRAWPLAFGWRGTPCSAAGALLAGDAASLVSPLSGSGIHAALVSGIAAARTANAALRANDTSATWLRRYDRYLARTLAPRLCLERALHNGVGTPQRVESLLAVLARIPGANRALAPILLNLG